MTSPTSLSMAISMVICRFLGLLLICAICLMLLFLLWHGLPAIDRIFFFGSGPIWAALTGARPVWDGIWPACAGTLCLVALSVGICLFPSIGCGIYLSQFSYHKGAKLARLCLDILAGTPSIVMGLFGFTLILFLRHNLFPDVNTSLFLAASCLSLLILPALATTVCQALDTVPHSLKLTGIALGFSQAQNLRYVLIPAARGGINAGIILAVGRAAEDTAVIMLTGAVANAGMPGLGRKFEALSFSIFYTAAQYQDQNELMRGFGSAIILLAISACLLGLASFADYRFRKK